MVICLEQCVDLHMAQLMPLPLTVSCFSKIQIGFTFLVLAHLDTSPGQRAVKRVCVCVCVCLGHIACVQCIDLACCYRCSMICLSDTTMICSKTAKLIDMPLVDVDSGGPKEPCIRWGWIPSGEGAVLGASPSPL